MLLDEFLQNLHAQKIGNHIVKQNITCTPKALKVLSSNCLPRDNHYPNF